jgi:hypothetical protein
MTPISSVRITADFAVREPAALGARVARPKVARGN